MSQHQPLDSHFQSTVRAVAWHEGQLRLLDQRLLPGRVEYLDYQTAGGVAQAIREMVVRGAPAIGIAAAYGVVLAARSAVLLHGADWRQGIEADLDTLAAARPTAVNLHWALAVMRGVFAELGDDPEPRLLVEAIKIHNQDIAANHAMAEIGADLIGDSACVMTHCNAGALATGGYGTALGVIRTAFGRGALKKVYANETRPWLQGSRLTSWELTEDNIPVSLIADTAASYVLSQGQVQWIIVGADRITANGDVANKIGTYQLAISARHHGVKFMVAAPLSTIDRATLSGADVPIEQRDGRELSELVGKAIAPAGIQAENPVFDITPAPLIDAIVTEKGAILAPDQGKIARLF